MFLLPRSTITNIVNTDTIPLQWILNTATGLMHQEQVEEDKIDIWGNQFLVYPLQHHGLILIHFFLLSDSFPRDLEEGRAQQQPQLGIGPQIRELHDLQQDPPPQVRVADPFWSDNTPPNHQQQFSDVCLYHDSHFSRFVVCGNCMWLWLLHRIVLFSCETVRLETIFYKHNGYFINDKCYFIFIHSIFYILHICFYPDNHLCSLSRLYRYFLRRNHNIRFGASSPSIWSHELYKNYDLSSSMASFHSYVSTHVNLPHPCKHLVRLQSYVASRTSLEKENCLSL